MVRGPPIGTGKYLQDLAESFREQIMHVSGEEANIVDDACRHATMSMKPNVRKMRRNAMKEEAQLRSVLYRFLPTPESKGSIHGGTGPGPRWS